MNPGCECKDPKIREMSIHHKRTGARQVDCPWWPGHVKPSSRTSTRAFPLFKGPFLGAILKKFNTNMAPNRIYVSAQRDQLRGGKDNEQADCETSFNKK